MAVNPFFVACPPTLAILAILVFARIDWQSIPDLLV
jgi:hypothetical protein